MLLHHQSWDLLVEKKKLLRGDLCLAEKLSKFLYFFLVLVVSCLACCSLRAFVSKVQYLYFLLGVVEVLDE